MFQKSSLLTVSELTNLIKDQLEDHFSLVKVQGEVSNCIRHASGHWYFDLKDKEAKIPAVCFKGNQRGVPRPPKEGDQLTVIGSLSVYAPHGRYQILVTQIFFSGLGEQIFKFEALKKELAARGWFSAEHKKPLPPYPKIIGVVTSPTGAVIHDIIHILRRRYKGFHLRLHPVAVQGEGAKEQIAEAIRTFNQYQLADVLIVGRGGGSLEDLWAFNEECVAKAIFESHIPIISAVGHETDVTLADFVADVRAPTPSAAAEIVSSFAVSLQESLLGFAEKLTQIMQNILRLRMQKIDDLSERLDLLLRHLLQKKKIALLGMKKEAESLRPTTQILHQRQKLQLVQKHLTHSIERQISRKKELLKHMAKALAALDPQNVLLRGYAILFDENSHSVIVSREQILEDHIIKARLADGEARLCSLKKPLSV